MKNARKCWIATINLTAIGLMPTLMFLAFSYRATAEDPGVCFMVTSSGKTIALGQLCRSRSAIVPEGEAFRIPIKRRIGNTPIIDVTFNQKETFEMILDTGASSTLITLQMANALKLKTTGIMQAQIADGSQVQFSTSQVKTIAVGGVIAQNLEVAIAPKAGIGLLGHNFFGNYDIKILEQEIEFYHR